MVVELENAFVARKSAGDADGTREDDALTRADEAKPQNKV